jgi:hypothetical protein
MQKPVFAIGGIFAEVSNPNRGLENPEKKPLNLTESIHYYKG